MLSVTGAQVMVCITAFGMGVDVPDVDLVVRIGCPSSLEELVQEFGRARRDGRQAEGRMNSNLIGIIYFIHHLILTVILLYKETDLQYALYWCKSCSPCDWKKRLLQFQDVWRYDLIL